MSVIVLFYAHTRLPQDVCRAPCGIGFYAKLLLICMEDKETSFFGVTAPKVSFPSRRATHDRSKYIDDGSWAGSS